MTGFSIGNFFNKQRKGPLISTNLSYGLEALKGFPNTTFIDCRLQSPMKAHGFDNPSYQRVFYENIYMDLKQAGY